MAQNTAAPILRGVFYRIWLDQSFWTAQGHVRQHWAWERYDGQGAGFAPSEAQARACAELSLSNHPPREER